ncbi:MAG: hypothetical protein ACLFV6_15810 [Spirulinaceae cyanobacterium]
MATESEQIIQDFLTLLQREKDKTETSILTPTEWEALADLEQELNRIEDDPESLAEAILDWCEKYPNISESLNNEDWAAVRAGMKKEGQKVPQTLASENISKITNKSIVQETIKTARNEQSQ